jgi:hypothetical protein
MDMSQSFTFRETGQAIGNNVGFSMEVLGCPTSYFLGAKTAYPAETGMDLVAFLVSGYRRQKRCFPKSTATSFTAMFDTSPIGVIHLDQPVQRHRVIGRFHDQLEFMFDSQRSICRNTEEP